MKIKSFIIAGLVVAFVSPVMADDDGFKVTVSKDGDIITDGDSARLVKLLEQYNNAQKLSDEIRAARQSCLSHRGTWYDGYCISQNPCKSEKDSDEKHCVKDFKNVQVATNIRAARIVKTYVQNVLKWEGCAEMKIPKSKATGQDYITCQNTDGDIRVFEFDDMSESVNLLADNNYAYAMCIAFNGKATFPKKKAHEVICKEIDASICEDKLNGAFELNECRMVM